MWKQGFLYSVGEQLSLSGCPADHTALSENAEQWERLALGVVNVAGYIRDIFVCQHPNFVFRFDPKLETRNTKFLCYFSGLPQCSPPFGAALCSGERGYREGFSI